jgi:uncharacterized membrane protein
MARALWGSCDIARGRSHLLPDDMNRRAEMAMKHSRWRPFIAACAALALLASQAHAQEREKCYGVALAGENDGIGRKESPGGATVNYQGDAWKWVGQGACPTIVLPAQTDGTPRRGAYEPLERDAP